MKRDSKDNLFLLIALFILVISIGVAFSNFSQFAKDIDYISGHAVDSGLVNVDIKGSVLINMTNRNLNWGSGGVNESFDFAVIDTQGNIFNGSWDPVIEGFIIKNEGNVNVSVNLSTQKNAETFIGTGARYRLKVNNIEENACTPGDYQLNEYFDAGNEVVLCTSLTSNSSIRVDVELTIPKLSSKKGILSDNLLITINEVEA